MLLGSAAALVLSSQHLYAADSVTEVVFSAELEQIDLSSPTLIDVPASPDDGFRYRYYLFVPEDIPRDRPARLLVEPNNTGRSSDDLELHDQRAKRLASRDYARRLAERLHAPLLVPAFPRPRAEWRIYTHALDRDTLLVNEGRLQRIDLQLIAMIRHAQSLLDHNGIPTKAKVFMNGFSASGNFLNRFVALHPELVRAAAAGAVNGLPILPFDTLDGVELPYPIGVADLDALAGKMFDRTAYREVSQYIYMGYLDRNDTLPYGDAWSDSERSLIEGLFGEEMMPSRWERTQALLSEARTHAQTVTYDGVAHRVLPEMWDDIVAFFRANDEEAQRKIKPYEYPFIPYREIETGSIDGLYWRGDPRLPEHSRNPASGVAFVISIAEWLPGQDHWQLREFIENAGFEFVLRATDRAEVKITRESHCGTTSSGNGAFQGFYVCLNAEQIRSIDAGVEYAIVPSNASAHYAWAVRDGLRLTRPENGETRAP